MQEHPGSSWKRKHREEIERGHGTPEADQKGLRRAQH